MKKKTHTPKAKSKRQTCAKRYKIQKKVAEHNRKAKRLLKKKGGKKKKPIDPATAIPNECPFKQQVLDEMKDNEEKIQRAKEERRQAMKAAAAAAKAAKTTPDLSTLVVSAETRTNSFEKKQESSSLNEGISATGSNSFFKDANKVIQAADIVLEVVDARNPEGTRCFEFEKRIKEMGKRLIILLNKIDLVPIDNAMAWLKILRCSDIVLPFKASTSEQDRKLGHLKTKRAGKVSELSLKTAFGCDKLMKLINNLSRNKGVKTAISIGIIGYPNTGKSSVINSLKRNRVCGVGAMPGVTRTLQEIHLDKHIKLIDSPGIVAASSSCSEVELALKCSIKPENVSNYEAVVEEIIARCGQKQLMLTYTLPAFDSVDDLLIKFAKETGRIRKGGVPDSHRAAVVLMHDWAQGRLLYFTQPPVLPINHAETSSEIVTEFSKEFDFSGECDALYEEDELSSMQVDSGEQPAEDVLCEDDGELDEAMETNENLEAISTFAESKRLKMGNKKQSDDEDDAMAPGGGVQLNKANRLRFKKEKRARKRTEQLASKLSDKLDLAL